MSLTVGISDVNSNYNKSINNKLLSEYNLDVNFSTINYCVSPRINFTESTISKLTEELISFFNNEHVPLTHFQKLLMNTALETSLDYVLNNPQNTNCPEFL